MRNFFLLIGFLTYAWTATAQESIIAPHVRIRLLAPDNFSSQEETLVGVLFEPEEHWHVYWKNPGDSGMEPKFNFSTTTAEVGPLQWPTPSRLKVAHLTNLGYEGRVVYLFALRPKTVGELTLNIDLEWLVCKEECIPGFAPLSLKRPVNDQPSRWKSEDFALIQESSMRVPLPVDQAPFQLQVKGFGEGFLSVVVNGAEEGVLESLELFPTSNVYIRPKRPERTRNEFKFETVPGAVKPMDHGFVAQHGKLSWEFQASSPRTSSHTSLWALIGLAFLGGVLLNLMPCVFPVISIKAFSLLKEEGAVRTRDCMMYAFGVMVTFTILGAIFLLLRAFGASVGWGFQLQSPLVISGLMLLFFFMALNFLGVFEMGESVMNFAGRFSANTSSFGTGVLSVFVAAPCTGPFMGTALGAAITLPAAAALLVFLSLGAGLASPFLLFAAVPQSLSWLPRPGKWMLTAKKIFSIPLFATVVWLGWVLSQQTATVVTRQASAAWEPYDTGKLKAARDRGQSVFVDFTAAWCITCQVNKQVVLDTEAGQAAFKKADVHLMRADWTRYDPVITEALAQLGRSSVPVYAFYPKGGGEPRILPQILTLSMIQDLDTNTSNKGEEK